ncbi:aldo/keto reductase [Neobacillus cucumis]|uniref:aldo/keto reductase n=1 Tax=Neobacillus cucumis TaxID=1740721 RepID=UPI0019626D99|nr:aldo/keto reductase [Neobacillus cucumis]MBM7654985.1 aryl-alcohol dehydrogenase-like predicted oxidoreductase [Neobacillus cucumis]
MFGEDDVWPGKTEQDSFKILDRFVGNFIDTADVYTRGVSGEIVGKWLQGKKEDDYVIVTKVDSA